MHPERATLPSASRQPPLAAVRKGRVILESHPTVNVYHFPPRSGQERPLPCASHCVLDRRDLFDLGHHYQLGGMLRCQFQSGNSKFSYSIRLQSHIYNSQDYSCT